MRMAARWSKEIPRRRCAPFLPAPAYARRLSACGPARRQAGTHRKARASRGAAGRRNHDAQEDPGHGGPPADRPQGFTAVRKGHGDRTNPPSQSRRLRLRGVDGRQTHGRLDGTDVVARQEAAMGVWGPQVGGRDALEHAGASGFFPRRSTAFRRKLTRGFRRASDRTARLSPSPGRRLRGNFR
jgi:hypothetical protein